MTVEELLTMPTLRGLQLIAGASGVRGRISTVTVVDAPDGATWIKGGEFVITTAYAMKDDAGLFTGLLRTLIEHKAAGLGVKTMRYIKSIPPEALAMADAAAFPLVFIPDEYAFCDIINPALSLIVNRQSALLMQADLIHRRFLELAVNNNSVPEILGALSGLLDRPSVFVDIYFRQLYFSDPDGPLAQQLKSLQPKDITPAFITGYEHFTVENRREKFGYILLGGEPGHMEEHQSRVAIEYAAIVLILRMQTRISNQHIEEKYREVFLEDLLLNNVKTEDEIHNRAKLYGWSFPHGGVAAVVDINNIKRRYLKSLDPKANRSLELSVQSIFDASIQSMTAVFPDAKYYKQSDLIVFILSAPGRDREGIYRKLEEIFHRIQQTIRDQVSFTITLGVGEYVDNIRDIHQSYAQARTVIDLSYELEQFNCVLFYSRLGIYRLLATTLHTPEYADLCAACVKPLLEFDAKTNSALAETLQAVIRCGWNLKQTSDVLYVHYNSLKYRFSRICEILNMDLRDHENQLSVEVAWKMYTANGRNWL